MRPAGRIALFLLLCTTTCARSFSANSDAALISMLLGVRFSAPRYAYVVQSAGNTVSSYSVDLSGQLTQTGTFTQAGSPSMPVADANGRFLHLHTSGPNTVHWRTMTATGLTTAGGSRVTTSSATVERSIVYPDFMIGLVQGGGSTLQSYPLASDGTVGVPQVGMVAGTNYSAMAQHPTLPVAYVLENAGASIRVVDMSSSGVFTSRGFVVATAASSIAVDPSGRYLLVANANAASNLSLYSLDSQGFPIPHSSITAGGAVPAHIAFGPQGTYAYVARQAAGANLVTVKLAPFEVVSTAATGNTPGNGIRTLVVENSGRFLYVTGATPSGVALMSISAVDATTSSSVYYSFAVVPTIGLYHTTRCTAVPDADC